MILRAARRKYGNVKVTHAGETFDSKAEFARYLVLMRMQVDGEIHDLVRQPTFLLAPAVKIQGKTKRALTYRADFGYTTTATGERVTEDVKGAITAVYVVKRHLMAHLYGITILETRRATKKPARGGPIGTNHAAHG